MDQTNKPPPHSANRRSGRRFALSGSSRIECRKGTLGLGPNIAQSTVNLSETGVKLILKTTLEKGKEAEILLHGPGLTRPLRRVGRVIWSRPMEDGTCCAALRFDSPIPYADLQRVTKPLQ
jgi:hypothetical protein